MLEKLFTSRTRSKIITLFMLNPQEDMYVREITKKVQENVNSVRRELSNLEDMGLMVSRKRGNLKYYSINHDFPIYPELYMMVMKTEGVPHLLKDNITSLGQMELAFIYGSFASAQARPDSDLDILLVGNIDEDLLIQKLATLEKQLSREINYVLFSKEEYQERIKNNDSFIIHILQEPKILIIGDIDVGRT